VIVYILLYNCGDYYCGCPGGSGEQAGHIAGVYQSQEDAEKAQKRLPVRLQYPGSSWIKAGKVEP
jgi:hypothetical protein